MDVCTELNKQFEMQCLGTPSTFLGPDIVRPSPHISINQKGCIERMAQRFQLEHAAPRKTPTRHTLPLREAQDGDKLAHVQEYQELVGSLNHAAVYSRPRHHECSLEPLEISPKTDYTALTKARYTCYLHTTRDFQFSDGNAPDINIYGFAEDKGREVGNWRYPNWSKIKIHAFYKLFEHSPDNFINIHRISTIFSQPSI
jgi:hypothetical protein